MRISTEQAHPKTRFCCGSLGLAVLIRNRYKARTMGVRRRAREVALQIMFQLEFTPGLDAEEAAELYSGNFEMADEVRDFALKLVHGAQEQQEDIRNLIDAHSTHWKLDRMAFVDRNILKLAAYELKFLKDEVPQNVVINEAIEIGKKYGSTESGAFLNGILDNIAKALHQ